jgi:hypothetical protein
VIFLGDGKGSWLRWREAKFPSLAYDYGDVQAGDFNGDGHPDLALAVHLRGLIALLGDGKGGFRNASEGLDFALGGRTPFSSTALRIVDWNGDGRPDILAFGEGPGLMGGHLVHSSRGRSCTSTWAMGKGNATLRRRLIRSSVIQSRLETSMAAVIAASPPAPAS